MICEPTIDHKHRGINFVAPPCPVAYAGLMKPVLPACLALVVLVWVPAPGVAHHSLAELFDRESTITVTGTVTRVTWVNPHVAFHLDVADQAGQIGDWAVEMDPPHALERQGWSSGDAGCR